MYHRPVLLKESIEGLNIRGDGIYVDVTYGGGGHSRIILEKLTTGSLIAFDQDQDAMENKPEDARLILINANFRYMKNFLKLYKAYPVNGILADLGVSSHQFDTAERGFSLRFEGPLDLRMNRRKSITAERIVNTYSVNKLREIFAGYGELNNAGKISEKIETARSNEAIKTTERLKEILKPLAPRNLENKFFAKVFQALRIEVNDELGALRTLLEQSVEALGKDGRLVIISYHSLEDRLVKNYIKAGNFTGEVEKDFYGNVKVPFRPVNRKPVIPGENEIKENSRARSARLRIAEKI